MKSDAPPKQPVSGTEAIRMDDEDTALPRYQEDDAPQSGKYSEASAFVALHSPGTPQANSSFPVLRAFQDYLEAERVRSRQRTTMLTYIFAAIIVVILLTFSLIWHSIARSNREREAMLWQVAIGGQGQPPAQTASAESGTSDEKTAELVASAVAKAQADQAALFSEKLESMNELVETIQSDNARLKKALVKKGTASAPAKAVRPSPAKPITAKKPAVPRTEQPSPAPRKIAQEQPETSSISALSIPTVTPPPSPKGYASGSFGVRIPKEPNPLPWRIYMPMK